jgi:hypothetical protein
MSIEISEKGLSFARSINEPLRTALSLNNLGVCWTFNTQEIKGPNFQN